MNKDILLDNLPENQEWNYFFKENIKILENISNILENKNQYYPKNEDIFSIFEKINPNQIKIVIISKEPYSGEYENEPITDGIAMSMNRNIEIYDDSKKIPLDLKIVFSKLKSLKNDIKFKTYSLDSWVKQGVFLINTCFTVEKFKNNSHIQRNFWKPFVFKLIKKITDVNPECIFLLWGSDAMYMASYIPNSCYKFVSDYPSLLNDKFKGHMHLFEANKILEKQKKDKIIFDTY